MNLAVKGRIRIDASDKKRTELTRNSGAGADGLAPEDLALENAIFGGAHSKIAGGEYDAGFTAAYTAFSAALSQRSTAAPISAGMSATRSPRSRSLVLVIAIAATQVTQWTLWHTMGVIALAALNVVFMYLMPAPTKKGQQVRTEIEGFRLYMETAEKLQLNAVKVGSEAPPPMTTERYEKFLPYAVALGVEKPWTQHFERLIPTTPRTTIRPGRNMSTGQSLGALTGAMISNISSGVSSALPQSSSSSGSGGGGSSGGGGGGGGGGGW